MSAQGEQGRNACCQQCTEVLDLLEKNHGYTFMAGFGDDDIYEPGQFVKLHPKLCEGKEDGNSIACCFALARVPEVGDRKVVVTVLGEKREKRTVIPLDGGDSKLVKTIDARNTWPSSMPLWKIAMMNAQGLLYDFQTRTKNGTGQAKKRSAPSAPAQGKNPTHGNKKQKKQEQEEEDDDDEKGEDTEEDEVIVVRTVNNKKRVTFQEGKECATACATCRLTAPDDFVFSTKQEEGQKWDLDQVYFAPIVQAVMCCVFQERGTDHKGFTARATNSQTIVFVPCCEPALHSVKALQSGTDLRTRHVPYWAQRAVRPRPKNAAVVDKYSMNPVFERAIAPHELVRVVEAVPGKQRQGQGASAQDVLFEAWTNLRKYHPLLSRDPSVSLLAALSEKDNSVRAFQLEAAELPVFVKLAEEMTWPDTDCPNRCFAACMCRPAALAVARALKLGYSHCHEVKAVQAMLESDPATTDATIDAGMVVRRNCGVDGAVVCGGTQQRWLTSNVLLWAERADQVAASEIKTLQRDKRLAEERVKELEETRRQLKATNRELVAKHQRSKEVWRQVHQQDLEVLERRHEADKKDEVRSYKNSLAALQRQEHVKGAMANFKTHNLEIRSGVPFKEMVVNVYQEINKIWGRPYFTPEELRGMERIPSQHHYAPDRYNAKNLDSEMMRLAFLTAVSSFACVPEGSLRVQLASKSPESFSVDRALECLICGQTKPSFFKACDCTMLTCQACAVLSDNLNECAGCHAKFMACDCGGNVSFNADGIYCVKCQNQVIHIDEEFKRRDQQDSQEVDLVAAREARELAERAVRERAEVLRREMRARRERERQGQDQMELLANDA
jgi:hypothetical protein